LGHGNRILAIEVDKENEFMYYKKQKIELDEKAISVSGLTMNWDEVYKISGYKSNYITVGTLTYLVFDYDFGEYIEFNDDMEGWDQLIRDLDKYLPISLADWREKLNLTKPNDPILDLYTRTD
jgi:hypothetical protein